MTEQPYDPGNIEKLKFPSYSHKHAPVRNANVIHEQSLSTLDKAALFITERVGSMGFFLIILTWTVCWMGYNIIASEVPALHLKSFDPFPAFVAYLLISNVIQILLMPLIMVGQNVQSRYSDIRSELDFEINQKAEREVKFILRHLEHNTNLILRLMEHLQCRISEKDVKELSADIGNLLEELKEPSTPKP